MEVWERKHAAVHFLSGFCIPFNCHNETNFLMLQVSFFVPLSIHLKLGPNFGNFTGNKKAEDILGNTLFCFCIYILESYRACVPLQIMPLHNSI